MLWVERCHRINKFTNKNVFYTVYQVVKKKKIYICLFRCGYPEIDVDLE